MNLALGIDTGGTYTDAALVDLAAGKVLGFAKSLTTYHDLSLGIGRALDQLFAIPDAPDPGRIGLVGLSTTLATNSIVEARHGRAALILIGYDAPMLDQYRLWDRLVVEDVVLVAGGHDHAGEEAAPLDLAALAAAVKARPGVEAFGVSAFFSVRNPSHELKARELISRLSGKPVTCGHELSQKLDSITRATTTALNATLIPILKELIAKVQQALEGRGLAGRLMVVKGDGSLVGADWARARPVETILSGPAASVVGATYLAGPSPEAGGRRWVFDLGGTTTDIAALEDGLPLLNREGARVGGYRTMVEAVDVRTVGLGGDSQVVLDAEWRLRLLPRRVIPLCHLAQEYPAVTEELARQLERELGRDTAGVFLVRGQGGAAGSEWEAKLLARLAGGPVAWETLRAESGPVSFPPALIDQAVRARRALLGAFTPTDALHALGELALGAAEASRLGAALLARRAGLAPAELCRRVKAEVSRRLAEELAVSALREEGVELIPGQDQAGRWLLERALSPAADPGRLAVRIGLGAALVGVGAPVATYAPAAAELLGSPLAVPPCAQVANAVGAVVGGVILRHKVMLRPETGRKRYRLFLPDGVEVFADKAAALARARAVVEAKLREEAHRAGGGEAQVLCEEVELNVPLAPGYPEALYMGTDLLFMVRGRPAAVRNGQGA